MATYRDEIEAALKTIRETTRNGSIMKRRMEADLAAVQEKYQAFLTDSKKIIDSAERRLRSLAIKHEGEIFPPREDLAVFSEGRLIRRIMTGVRRARGILERIQNAGFGDGVKITCQVDWDAVEKWPDEKLAAVGTERRTETKIDYELK